jgi:hypothetical protein
LRLSNNNHKEKSLLSFGLMNWDKKFLLKCSNFTAKKLNLQLSYVYEIFMHARLWTEPNWILLIDLEKLRKEERISDSMKPKAREAHKKIFWHPKMEFIIWHFETQTIFFFFCRFWVCCWWSSWCCVICWMDFGVVLLVFWFM